MLARPRLLRGDDELAYLLRALRNTLVSQRRARSRRPETTELVEEVGRLAAGRRPAAATENRQVYAAIHELPEGWDALVAVDIVGLSYGEAARALEVKEGTRRAAVRARDRVAASRVVLRGSRVGRADQPVAWP